MVCATISNLDSHKVGRLDAIPVIVLKQCTAKLALKLYNKCLA